MENTNQTLNKMIKSFVADWKDSTGETLTMKKAKEIIGKNGLSEWKEEIKNNNTLSIDNNAKEE